MVVVTHLLRMVVVTYLLRMVVVTHLLRMVVVTHLLKDEHDSSSSQRWLRTMAGAGLGGEDLTEVGDEGWGESGVAGGGLPGDVQVTGVEAAGGD